MNPYQFLAQQPGVGDVRDLVQQLGAWHDSMVLHQRTVRQVGAEEACDESCAHAVGRDLWIQAKMRLGPVAETLTFLRRSVERTTRES
ncbi:MAG TPA: hypothetical protein PKK95_01095 [Vicinamibacterales bacterium]|nr:hypothetical protein [Acidobacteriota bacterium]HOC16828.1 hypothetical protein [Vicinamibacterales bacterium]